MKDKKILFSILLVFVFFLTLGLAYAYFSSTVSGEGNNIIANVGDLELTYTDSLEISALKIEPGWTTTKTISVENTGSLDTDYSIEWASLTNEIGNDELVMSATCVQTLNGTVNDTCPNILETPVGTETGSIVHNINIGSGYKHTYVITFVFKEMSSEQNYNQGKAFNGLLNILGETYTLAGILYDSNGDPIAGAEIEMHSNPKYAVTDENGNFEIVGLEAGNHLITITSSTDTVLANDSIILSGGESTSVTDKDIIVNSNIKLASVNLTLGETSINTITINQTVTDKILADNTAYADNLASTYVTAQTGINFGAISSDTNGKGLYYTTDLSKTEGRKRVYYYRGAVTNNYLIFGGFCWRIVRTVEDGSVRLRYGGTPTSGSCPQTGANVNIGSNSYGVSDNAYAGYMPGKFSQIIETTSNSFWGPAIPITYYFGSSYTYDEATNLFTLSGNIISGVWNSGITCTSSNCPVLNYYTCHNTLGNVPCSILYKVSAYYSSPSIGVNVHYINNSSLSYADALMNLSSSPVKTTTDSWYYNNLIDYSSKIADTPYCSDRSLQYGSGYGLLSTTYKVYNRFTSKKYTYKCTQLQDKYSVSVSKGNGKLLYPIGQLTFDELAMAGNTSSINMTNYLYINDAYWTMSPSVFQADIGVVHFSLGNQSSITNNSGTQKIVPVISLNKREIVSSGNGTYSDPYIVN